MWGGTCGTLLLLSCKNMHADPQTILCVDDEEPGLEMRRILLESAGYRVLTAKSGREGIRIFNSEKIDAVILDYWMAGMNGIAVARQLKHSNPATPIIMLSAYGTILDEALGVADVWIRKGEEDPQYLLARLKEMIEARSQK
jgi:CheY-like chemotaxis protein